MANFKKVGDIAFVEAVTENDSILIERDGTLKRTKAEGIGGGKRNVTVLLDTPTATEMKDNSYETSLQIEGLADYFTQGKAFKLRVISRGAVSDVASVSEAEIIPTVHTGSWLVTHGGGRGYGESISIGTVLFYYSVNPEGVLTFYYGTNVAPNTCVSVLRVEVETYE